MPELVKEIFFNVTILISFITLSNQLFREKIATPSSPLHRKLITGIAAGFLGCLLMVFGVQVTPNSYLDLRCLPIIMIALYASFPSAVVTSLVIGIFRIAYFGINPSSIAASFSVISIGVACGLIGKTKLKRPIQWILSVLTEITITGAVIALLINDLQLFRDVFVVYCGGTVTASFALYFLLENITKSNMELNRTNEDAKKDFLTGLNNVRRFDAFLNNAIAGAKQRKENLSFLFIDIDFFKKVNDTYGHAEGDLVLKGLSEILKKSCRNFDIISRNGGEEFSVILLDCPLQRAVEVAERIRKNVEQSSFILSSGKDLKITVSIGVSSYPENTSDPEKLVEHADIALYNAKRDGRNLVSTKRESEEAV
ncbi:MAG: GGDEF domain-containing protein [Clostridiales bacterium]|nr:GGDEF domain-containing protein [Clostridiales bacterium]